MQKLTHEQELYIACLYGYSLQPESWQAGYNWRDFVVDADFSCRLGVLVKVDEEYEPIVSVEQAQSIYEGMRESIEKVGLDEFYEQNFGHLYHREEKPTDNYWVVEEYLELQGEWASCSDKFATEDEAEDCMLEIHARELQNHWDFSELRVKHYATEEYWAKVDELYGSPYCVE